MQEAAGASQLLAAHAKGEPAERRASHNEALCRIAASRAAAANAQVRCGQCETCICSQGVPMPRRCLLNRAAAAAAAGHSGAQARTSSLTSCLLLVPCSNHALTQSVQDMPFG